MHTDDFDVYKMTDVITKQLEPIKDKILQVIKSHNLSPVYIFVDNSHELITGLSRPLFAPAALTAVGFMPSRRVMSSGLK